MLAFVVVATSCASRGKGGAREPAPRTDLLTAEELSAQGEAPSLPEPAKSS